MDGNRHARSTSAVLSAVAHHLAALVRGEFLLATVELVRNARRARNGVLMIAGAALLAVVGLGQIADAAAGALVSAGIPMAWSGVIVGGAALLIAAILTRAALGAFARTTLIPRGTVRNLRRDAEVIKETFHD